MLTPIIIDQSVIINMIGKAGNDPNPNLHQYPNQQDISYIPSKYSKAFNSYSRTQIKLVMPFIASISKTSPFNSLYPICKILKAISKIFMLNQVQVIFLGYLIRQTEWDIKDKTIYHNAENVQDIIYYSNDNFDYKRIILYLMVTAYTVKFFLNETTGQILEQANKRCPNFKQIFQGWNKKHSNIITKINPRILNIIYKKLYSSIKGDQFDFNMMVDAIIQISPAYNPERQKIGMENKKNGEKKDQQFFIKKQNINCKNQKNNNLFNPGNAVFSSSGLLNMMALHQEHQQTVEVSQNLSGFSPFIANCSDRIRQQYLGILGSSVVGGIQPNYDIKEDDDCGQIVVGLQDGQSQQNIIFEDRDNIQGNGIIGNTSNSCVGGFQPYMQPLVNQQPSTQESLYYTSIINLSRKPINNEPSGKDGIGTSAVMLLGGSITQNPNTNNAQINILNGTSNKSNTDSKMLPSATNGSSH